MSGDTRPPILTLLTHPATLAGVLAAVNVWICRELFVVEYLQYVDSIAGAYVGLARWIVAHPTEWGWFPLWYGGIPFQNAYPPLLHFLTAAASGLSGLSPAGAHHTVTAAMYCLGPVTLYLLAWRMSGDRVTSFFVGLFYSVVAPSALLIPEITRDMGTAFGSRRLHALVRYGEGPHVTAMTLLPLALVALHWALGKRRPVPVYGAALALAAVVLTNWLGAFALAAAVAAMMLAREDGLKWRTLLTAAGIGMLAYAMAAPWIPPSTLADIRRNAQHTVGSYPMGWAQAGYLLLLLGAIVALAWMLRRIRSELVEGFAALFLISMAGVTLAWHWLGVYVLPQPARYHLEMEMALALAIPFAAKPFLRRLRMPARAAITAVCVLLAFVPAMAHRRYARELIKPTDMQSGLQYQTASWLHENLPGARVFIQGSSRFWMNAFADNPQLGGGFDQGITNPFIPHLTYGISHFREDGARSVQWMQAFGIDAVVVGGPQSRDPLKDFQDAAKFDGLLKELHRDGDDVIYEVPRRSRSLAHVIPPDSVISEDPVNYLGTKAVSRYLAALEDETLPVAKFTWESTAEASIETDLPAGHLIAVQVSYDPGWRASVNGEQVKVFGDEVGLTVVDPKCNGPCTIKLTYDGGLEAMLARLACGGAFAAGAIWIAWLRRRRR